MTQVVELQSLEIEWVISKQEVKRLSEIKESRLTKKQKASLNFERLLSKFLIKKIANL